MSRKSKSRESSADNLIEFIAEREKFIETSEWMPAHPPLQYPAELIKWIDSINSGWEDRRTYIPFELYKKQAQLWLMHRDSIENYHTEEDQLNFISKEAKRCQQNTYYFANKYGYLKEGDAMGGFLRMDCWEPQKVVCFLADSWYNLIIGKGRQIGFTSIMGMLAIKRINFMKSYFTKFITHTKEKGEEIFRDKIRWSFGMLPEWFRHVVSNDSLNMLALTDKSVKGDTSGANSRIEVVTPKVDAINGGSPNLTMIDEIGLVDIFTRMMNEGRPTLFYFDPNKGNMVMRRQLLCWGTGGEMDKAGAVFEAEYKAALERWRKRDFKYGLIPLFFDCYARQGMTSEIYNSEKKVYYSITGVEKEKSRVQFHQHYPLSIDDMFLRSSKTILPVSTINKHLIKIYNLKGRDKVQYGYFQPKYNENKAIIGAKWFPTTGMSDDRTTAAIFRHPEKGWRFRYYQGTDPINSESGHSKMSSSIWDAYENTIPAMVFFRVKDYKQCFMQCMLLGLYYEDDRRDGCRELLENNIGDMYFDFLVQHGMDKRIISNSELPKYMQHKTSSKWWGINNKTNTAGHISNKIIEMCDAYADNIFMPYFFLQLKTFVEKELRTPSSVRQSRYQAADLRYDYDDAIFSAAFAYIAAQVNSRFIPEDTREGNENEKETVVKYVQNSDTNYHLVLAEVNKKTGRVMKYLSGRR